MKYTERSDVKPNEMRFTPEDFEHCLVPYEGMTHWDAADVANAKLDEIKAHWLARVEFINAYDDADCLARLKKEWREEFLKDAPTVHLIAKSWVFGGEPVAWLASLEHHEACTTKAKLVLIQPIGDERSEIEEIK